ncbi:MAG: methylthioribulose 1-phosphate dehydratase [Alphaproteobacteria bacterium]
MNESQMLDLAYARAVAVSELVAAGRWLDGRGFAPATSGNYSVRLDDGAFLVTVSGAHKGALGPGDFLVIEADGRVREQEKKPSAETSLHRVIYSMVPTAGAVLHTHSVNATVLSRYLAGKTDLVLEGYELLKAFRGVETHETAISVPIFDNLQDMAALAVRVAARLGPAPAAPGFLIRGHGLYAWGMDTAEARRHVDAFEFLLACELERARLMA